MYKRDVPKIVSYIKQEGSAGIVHAGSFVLCTIQTPLSRVAPMVSDIKSVGRESAHLWGSKRRAYDYINDNQKLFYRLLIDRPYSTADTTDILLKCPGLGLPKVSFLMQICGWNTACMDVHNLRRLGLPSTITKIGKVKPDTRATKIQRYLTLTREKGSEYWWDSWCEYVADNRVNKTLPTGDDVSRYHYEAIAGG